MKTLVVGCDASGKSTLMEAIHSRYGDRVAESSSRDDAITFKKSNSGRLIDGSFIDEREEFYLTLEKREMSEGQQGDLVTSNSTLVTRFAHNIMRRCIGEPYDTDDDIIRYWQDDEIVIKTPAPDVVAYTHAPSVLINRRIMYRQRAGWEGESFWGFNAPFFLDSYQSGYISLIAKLAQAGLICVAIDTGQMSPEQAIEHYSLIRDNL